MHWIMKWHKDDTMMSFAVIFDMNNTDISSSSIQTDRQMQTALHYANTNKTHDRRLQVTSLGTYVERWSYRAIHTELERELVDHVTINYRSAVRAIGLTLEISAWTLVVPDSVETARDAVIRSLISSIMENWLTSESTFDWVTWPHDMSRVVAVQMNSFRTMTSFLSRWLSTKYLVELWRQAVNMPCRVRHEFAAFCLSICRLLLHFIILLLCSVWHAYYRFCFIVIGLTCE